MGSQNPYIDHLKEALDENGFEVDRSVARRAFADFLRKGLFSDTVILNWIENLPSRRFGILQTIFLMVWLPLLKIFRVKIIWIKHNKVSHTKKWFGISRMIQQTLERQADHIIVHATDAGITDPAKTLLIPHPSNTLPEDILPPDPTASPAIDLLIWGSILPYKGILEFLRYAKTDPLLRQLSIHIIGKCEPDYWRQLQQQAGSNTTLVNKFVQEEELHHLFQQSRFILFTYNQQSVIASGVLADSLVACKRIIAPDCGAFRDMAQQQHFVSLFDDFAAISSIYRENYNNYNLSYTDVCEFVAQNSWYNMGSKIKKLLRAKTAIPLTNRIKISETP